MMIQSVEFILFVFNSFVCVRDHLFSFIARAQNSTRVATLPPKQREMDNPSSYSVDALKGWYRTFLNGEVCRSPVRAAPTPRGR